MKDTAEKIRSYHENSRAWEEKPVESAYEEFGKSVP